MSGMETSPTIFQERSLAASVVVAFEGLAKACLSLAVLTER
jgi:hypothetical protein